MLKDADRYKIVAIKSDQCRYIYTSPCNTTVQTYHKCFSDGSCREVMGTPKIGELVCDPNQEDSCYHYECIDIGHGYIECAKVFDTTQRDHVPNLCDPNDNAFAACHPLVPKRYVCTPTGDCVLEESYGPNQCDPEDPNRTCFSHLECREDDRTGIKICVNVPGRATADSILCDVEGEICESISTRKVWLCVGDYESTNCFCKEYETNDPNKKSNCTNHADCCKPKFRTKCKGADCILVEELGHNECELGINSASCAEYHKECVENPISGVKKCVLVLGAGEDKCDGSTQCQIFYWNECDPNGNCVQKSGSSPQLDACVPGFKECSVEQPYNVCVKKPDGSSACEERWSIVPPLYTCTEDTECNNVVIDEPEPPIPPGGEAATAQCQLLVTCEKDYGYAKVSYKAIMTGVKFKEVRIYYKMPSDINYTFWKKSDLDQDVLTFTDINCCENITFKMLVYGVDGISRASCTTQSNTPLTIEPILTMGYLCPSAFVYVQNLQEAEVLGFDLYYKEVFEGQDYNNVEWQLVESIDSTSDAKLYSAKAWEEKWQKRILQNPAAISAPYCRINYRFDYVNAFSVAYARLVYRKGCYTKSIEKQITFGCCPKARFLEVPPKIEICEKTRYEKIKMLNGEEIVDIRNSGQINPVNGDFAQSPLHDLNTGCLCTQEGKYDNKFSLPGDALSYVHIVTNNFQTYNGKTMIDHTKELITYMSQYKRPVSFDVTVFKLKNTCDPDAGVKSVNFAGTELDFLLAEFEDKENDIKYKIPETDALKIKCENLRWDYWSVVAYDNEGEGELERTTSFYFDNLGPVDVGTDPVRMDMWRFLNEHNMRIFSVSNFFSSRIGYSKFIHASDFKIGTFYANSVNFPSVEFEPPEGYTIDCETCNELNHSLLDVNKITYHFLDDNLSPITIDSSKSYRISFILELSIQMKNDWPTILNNINAFTQMMNLTGVDVSYNISVLHNISNVENSIGFDVLSVQNYYDVLHEARFTKNTKYLIDQLRNFRFFNYGFDNIALWNCIRDIHKMRRTYEKKDVIEIYVPLIQCKNIIDYNGAKTEVDSYNKIFLDNYPFQPSQYPSEIYMTNSLRMLNSNIFDLMAKNRLNMRINYLYNGAEKTPAFGVMKSDSKLEFNRNGQNAWSSNIQFDPRQPRFIQDENYYPVSDFYKEWWFARINVNYEGGFNNIYNGIKFAPNWLRKGFKLGKIEN